jgi:Na+/proline symporter
MFVQRAMAVRSRSVVRVFVLGGLLFAIVPITLSLLGFIAASPSVAAGLHVTDPQVVGAFVVGHLLPHWALLLFCVMALAGLASTLDSAYCALSALGSIDVYRRYLRPDADDRRLLSAARLTMLVMALLGTLVALLQPKLLWVFLIYGALASAGMFPVILSLYWRRLDPRGVLWGVALSLAIGTPLSIIANVLESPHLIVAAALTSVGVSLLVCLVSGWLHPRECSGPATLDRAALMTQPVEDGSPR